MTLMLDVADNKASVVIEFLKSVSFITNIKSVGENEITNVPLLKSIEAYEAGSIKPIPVNIDELKALLNA